jgi:hypothetical protein
MKKLAFIFLLITPFLASGQLWTEDFTAEANGATSGTAGGTVGGTWSVTTTPAGTFSKQTLAGFPLFQVSSTTTEGVWQSAAFSIAGTGRATIDATIAGLFVGGGDYIRCYYRVDGGAETLFYEQLGGGLSFTGVASAIVTGSTLQIVIRSSNDGSFLGLDTYTVDDIIVTAVNTLYSRKSGNWNDATVGAATWSIVGLGGTSCDCTPLVTDYVIVGNANTVNLNVAATAGGVEVRNTGTLRWTASNIDLNIDRGILQVDLGGTINRNAQTNVQIDFDRGVITTFIVNGSITAEDIEITAADVTINLSGSGSLILTDDFLITQDNDIVNNNLSGTFSIADDLIFSEDVSQFVNNRTLTVVSDISAAANTNDDNVFTNSTGAVLNVSGFNPNDADFDLLNSGTINQSGNFSNISTADTNFSNLTGAIWNWTLTPNTTFDTDMSTELNCTADGNLFTYSGAGPQRIIPTSYDDLTLSVSGAKDSNGGDIAVAGNWVVSGTASFTEGAGTVTFNGAGIQSLTNAAGETFNNLTLNNSSVSGITFNNNVTISTVLTMTDGNVNLSGTTLTLSSTANGALVHGLTSASGWMYGGFFTRTFAATGGSATIAVGNVAGLFPMGSATDWRPFFIGKNSIANSGGTITVSHTNGTGSTTVAFAEGIVRRHNSSWTLTKSAGLTTGTWAVRAGGTSFGTIEAGAAGLADLRMCTTTGVVGTHGPATGGPDYRVNRTGVTIASPLANTYHVASTDAVNSPLPIELISFNANLKSDIVELDWTTASELNNDFFTIERLNEEDDMFDQIATIKGSGTINEARSYQAYDFVPNIGKNYYRLKQTDFDGQFSYSKIVMVDFTETGEIVNIYPNPVNQQTLTIEVKQLKSGQQVPLQIRSMLGVHTFMASYTADSTGSIKVSIPVDQWSQGLYLVQIGTDTPVLRKIVIE